MTDHATRAREIAERLANWVVTKRPVYFECETVIRKALAAALTRAAEEAAEEAHESHAWEISPAMAQAKIDQLNAQLQAAQPVWSKEKPTVGGCYGWKRPGHEPDFAHVWEIDGRLRFQCHRDSEDDAIWVDDAYPDTEWAGPLPMPREA